MGRKMGIRQHIYMSRLILLDFATLIKSSQNLADLQKQEEYGHYQLSHH